MKIDAYRVVMLISTTVILLLIGWIANILMTNAASRPMGTYAETLVEPHNENLCPGDTVTYSQTVDYHDTPAIVMIVGSVWSVDKNRTVVYDTAPRYANYTEPTVVEGSGKWEIPPDFEPGVYERRLAGQAQGRSPQMFSVPFTVVDDCT